MNNFTFRIYVFFNGLFYVVYVVPYAYILNTVEVLYF